MSSNHSGNFEPAHCFGHFAKHMIYVFCFSATIKAWHFDETLATEYWSLSKLFYTVVAVDKAAIE
jgi:hypothetical protein